MADDTHQSSEKPGFDDIFSDIAEDTSFAWDDEELDTSQAEQLRQVVCFRIGADIFAIPADSVREILGDLETTDLPGAPPHVEGIAVIRRQVVGLLSLRRFLGIDQAQADEADSGAPSQGGASGRILMVESAHFTVGLKVDEVLGLDEWAESLLNKEGLPSNLHAKTQHYARGVREQDDTFCVYLDLESLLDDAAVR